MFELFFQFLYGGTWLKVSRGGYTSWVRKDLRTPDQHYVQIKRRFMNWPWTHTDARSSRRWTPAERAM